MKREIKFRQVFFNYKNDEFSHFHYWGIDFPNKGMNTFPGTSNHQYTVDNNEYVGLKDKQGNEIYEGDIIKMDWSEKKWQVISNYAQFDMQYNTQQIPLNDSVSDIESEIIGNIYENNELIKD